MVTKGYFIFISRSSCIFHKGKTDLSNADSFKTTFKPYIKKCLIKADGGELFAGGWYDQGGPLSDERINAAIFGRIAVAYFATTSPRAFGIDIDDHTGRGNDYLLQIYDKVVSRFGNNSPSIVAASPHGLHVWYLLDYPMPWQILEQQTKAAVQGLPVEVRPTPSQALRIPTQAALLDPDKHLLPINRDFEDVLSRADSDRSYNPAYLFGEAILPQAVRSTLHDRRKKYGALRYSMTINKAQEEHLLLPGCTNDALNALVPLYRAAGMDPEDAAIQITGLLPPVYIGELRDYTRLLKRVKAYYKGVPDPKPYNVQRSLFTSPIAENVATAWKPCTQNTDLDTTCLDEAHIRTYTRGTSPGNVAYRNRQARESIKVLVSGIIEWRDFVQDMYKDPLERSKCNYLYPYFSKNIGDGFFPVPQSVLNRINHNYNRYFDYLQEIGFLEKAPYKYVPGAGICNYYRINSDNFAG